MKIGWRASSMAMACAVALFQLPAFAQTDTSRLPRIGGAQELYASAGQTIFTTRDPVEIAAALTSKALNAAGWQGYEPPFSSKSDNPAQAILSFKKGPQGLSVFVSVAPAQGGQTNVQYALVPLDTDLPFPRTGEAIEYAPDRPYLKSTAREPVDRLLAYYGQELSAMGWAAWSTRTASRIPAGEPVGQETDSGAQAIFVRDGKAPILLALRRQEGGTTLVEIKTIPKDLLNPKALQESIAAREAEQEAARKAAAAEFAARHQAASDAMTDQIMAQANLAAANALAGAMGRPAAAPPKSDAPLQALAGASAPIPVPANASGLDVRSGRVEFRSAASLAAVADFYRAQMKARGWAEHPSVIKTANMAVLVFQKDGKRISLTLMQMGAEVRVSADGSGLAEAGKRG